MTKKKSEILVKKKASASVSVVESEDISLIDLARREKNLVNAQYSKPDGSGKKYTREVFKLWILLPDQFKGAPERVTGLLGITDEIALELLKLGSMQAFAKEFNVMPATLTRWRKSIEESDEYMNDVKRQMKKYTRNVLGALYRKALEEADAPRVMAWMKIIEDWREQLGIDHNVVVSVLDEEERKALDHLLEKNAD